MPAFFHTPVENLLKGPDDQEERCLYFNVTIYNECNHMQGSKILDSE